VQFAQRRARVVAVARTTAALAELARLFSALADSVLSREECDSWSLVSSS
jgi:hypothetical protein